MQQSSATPQKRDVGKGLTKIVACFSFWHGVIPTSYFVFNAFYTCSTHFSAIMAKTTQIAI